VQPLAEVLAEAYSRQGGGRVTIQGGGSTAGVQAVLSGVAQIGAVSRSLTDEESGQGLVEHIIAYDVLAIVVHPANPVGAISRPELRRLFAGDMSEWLPGRPIHLVSREAGSGSREAIRSLVGPISPRAIIQNSSGGIRAAVAGDPLAVGYVSLGVARLGGVKALLVDGVSPEDPQYLLSRPLSFVTSGPPSGEAAELLRFIRSAAGQKLIESEGLVAARVESSRR